MFRMVQLQEDDSPRELMALGVKLKRKNREPCILQPCPAHAESKCGIYAQRPVRCRRFECLQLKRVASGEITESMASAAIADAQGKVHLVRKLLQQSDGYDDRKSLSKCYEHVVAEWLELGFAEKAPNWMGQLTQAMRDLQLLLNRDFRLEPMELDAPLPFPPD